LNSELGCPSGSVHGVELLLEELLLELDELLLLLLDRLELDELLLELEPLLFELLDPDDLLLDELLLGELLLDELWLELDWLELDELEEGELLLDDEGMLLELLGKLLELDELRELDDEELHRGGRGVSPHGGAQGGAHEFGGYGGYGGKGGYGGNGGYGG
jgi:hypothetical protein